MTYAITAALCLPDQQLSQGGAEHGCASTCFVNALTKEVLDAVDHKACVPDALNLRTPWRLVTSRQRRMLDASTGIHAQDRAIISYPTRMLIPRAPQ